MLKHFKNTISLCPVCYKKIPAAIFIDDIGDDGVIINKTCSEHGAFSSTIETNSEFYLRCQQLNSQTIYPGYFVDVTKKCNMKGVCGSCYYPVDNNNEDITINHIHQDIQIGMHLAPFILTGGEPTLRSDLHKIMGLAGRYGNVGIVTNGSGINEESIKLYMPYLLGQNNTLSINLSIHNERPKLYQNTFKTIRACGKKLESVLCVINKLEDMDSAVELCNENSDIIVSCRIKAAVNVWDESKQDNSIQVSEMLSYMVNKFGAEPVWWEKNKSRYFNVKLKNIGYMLMRWYDVNNVDLIDIACGPYYKAKNGEIVNLLVAMLINEGVARGYVCGEPILQYERCGG